MSRLVEVTITPISTDPDVVTLQEVKEYCRIDFDDDDSIITRLIASSRQRLEQFTCRVFLSANCTAIYHQECGGDRILLSFSDNMQLLSGIDYTLSGSSYIDTEDTKVLLEYTAGYEAGSVPDWMKQAVLMDVAYRYENRGDVAAGSGINGEVKDFLKPYVKWSLI